MNKVNLVEISWGSEAPPDKDSRYNHVFGTHPLGKFCIEWKSWKESDSYTCYFNDEYWNDAYSLDEAKDFCQKHINKKINSCIVGVKMTQETERLKNQLLAAEAEIARLQSALDEIKSHIKSHLDEDYDEDDFDRGWLSAFKRINHNVNRITGTDK